MNKKMKRKEEVKKGGGKKNPTDFSYVTQKIKQT